MRNETVDFRHSTGNTSLLDFELPITTTIIVVYH